MTNEMKSKIIYEIGKQKNRGRNFCLCFFGLFRN